MLNAIELTTAKKLVSDRLANFPVVTVTLDEALEKILANDITCLQSLPQFNRSTVDGYAVNSKATFGACQSVPVILKKIGVVKMGQVTTFTCDIDSCVYVPTGGMLPKNTDAVVMIEHTSPIDSEILIYSPVKPHENMIETGEDILVDSLIFSKGTMLNSSKIGVLAGAGITEVQVYAPQRFAIISTGDEIIPIEEKLTACKIRDINSHLLKAVVKPFGEVVSSVIIKDCLKALIEAVGNALKISDIVLISGGSSVGNRDYTKQAILEFTKDLFIEGIALKPGKPTMVAKCGDKFIVGLPGHPMAATIAFNKVFIEGLYSAINVKEKTKLFAKAKTNFPSASGRATVMPVILEETSDGYYATPLFYKSGLISVLAKADGYIVIPTNEEGIPKNTLLEVYSL